jgi:hypothetical protein
VMVDRLVKLADMLVWVLDPLKYADASVHRRYLVPLAGHASVTSVVLNQADTLNAEQVKDCEADLRRLLDAEGLIETPVLVTSALKGTGLDDLRRVLAGAVAARQAATDRITADIDALLERFSVYAGDSVPGWFPPESAEPTRSSAAQLSAAPAPEAAVFTATVEADPDPASSRPPWEQDSWSQDDRPADHSSIPPWEDAGTSANGRVEDPGDWQPWQTTAAPTSPASAARPPWEDATPDGKAALALDPVMYIPLGPAGTLTAAFAKAAGVTAATETLNGVRERRAAGYIGWPPARLAARLRGSGPTSARRLLVGGAADTVQAQRSDIDNAITVFADEIGGPLPVPWSQTVRATARSRADEAQAALGAAVTQGMPPRDKVTGWWRLIALAQWLLLLLAAAGVVWIVLILATNGKHKSSLISDTSLTPWLGVMVVALLLLGWLIASWCQNMVVLAADREREQASRAIMSRIAAVTRELVLAPTGRELAEYERFRAELAGARRATPVT